VAAGGIGPVTAATPVVEAHGLTKRYGRTTALDGLDLEVRRGEVFALLGANGAGKTTVVKILLGLTLPSGGTAEVLGRPAGDPEARRRVGYLPELFRYQGWLTGREVLRLHAELAGMPRDGWAAAIDEVLAAADLAARADDRVATYSKGMQQRLGLAVALLGAPELVVLDEPSTALDPLGRHELRATIGALRERGTTVLLNSHQLGEVEQVCDRVAIIHRGKLLAVGSLGELLSPGGVRLRATGLDAAATERLRVFGELETDGVWLVIRAAGEEQLPAIVEIAVAAGAQVYGVELLQPSLEDRFRQLLEGA
jgi:ABC-2 type transport system ATP-binding protein